MRGDERRNKIIEILSGAKQPISATALAEKLGVSRQVIVSDVALLRTAGKKILSLARGYLLSGQTDVKRVFKVRHTDGEVEEELSLVVDFGGTVEDVFVYHRTYGTIRANMNIRTRTDIRDFLTRLEGGTSSLLKNITAGYHYHTVSADSEQTLQRIEEALREHRFLAPLQDYEPEELRGNT